MPKIIDYPRQSLKRALQLAEVVDRLGGECTAQSAAESMGNKMGGAFKALIGAAVKYGLISNVRSKLKTEPLFQDYKLAYNESQKQEALRRAFLTPPLFQSIAKRFQNQLIPPHFENLLIREHHVAEDFASRLVSYFNEGAKESGVLASNGTINISPTALTIGVGAIHEGPDRPATAVDDPDIEIEDDTGVVDTKFVRGYSVRITGPGMDSRIAINDEDDVDIVEAMLKKVRKLLKLGDDLLK
jgi:hypothetical protein